MLPAKDHVLKGDVKRADDSSLDTTTSSEENAKSLERDLADARAENAKLRADLESERAEKKLLGNMQDDPFAPREGKTLVWTDVSMTLVCNKVCLFVFPLASDTSLTMHLFIS
jgi:hypothetical protein